MREIRFDGWTLHPATGELLHADRRTRLQQQPLAVLLALLERPGELVTRETLIQRLWPRGVVDFDTALNSAVRRLRTALADHAEAPRYIETIPRRGYRFIGTLEDAPSSVPAGSVPQAIPPRGMRKIHRWWVAAAAVIGVAVLAAGGVVGGSRDPEPEFQDAKPAIAPEAEDRLSLADHFFQRRGPGDLDRARQQYEEVLVIQPDSAAALAGLASVYWIETVEGLVDPEQGLSRLRDAAERALALDPGLARAHLRLSQYRGVLGDRTESAWHASMAAALDPGDPLVLAFAASRAASDGRLDEAISLQRRALELEPLSHVSRYNLASFLLMDGRIEEAGEELRALRELGEDGEKSREALATVLMLEGRPGEARELALAWPEGRERWQVLAISEHALGDREQSEKALQALIACCGEGDPLRIAEVYGARGEADAAFTWLRRGIGTGRLPPWLAGSRQEAWVIVHSPYLASLHQDPRWAEWVHAVQAPAFPDRLADRR